MMTRSRQRADQCVSHVMCTRGRLHGATDPATPLPPRRTKRRHGDDDAVVATRRWRWVCGASPWKQGHAAPTTQWQRCDGGYAKCGGWHGNTMAAVPWSRHDNGDAMTMTRSPRRAVLRRRFTWEVRKISSTRRRRQRGNDGGLPPTSVRPVLELSNRSCRRLRKDTIPQRSTSIQLS